MQTPFPPAFIARSCSLNSVTSIRLIFGFLLPLALGLTSARAATFTVTNTNTAGAGSLSNAIAQANLSAVNATNFIQFAIPPLDSNTVQTITLPSNSSGLPQIIRRVVIDGYTQPGASSNTNAIGNNAKI